MPPSDDRELSEFERRTIRDWALADARHVEAEATNFGLQVAYYCDAQYWLPFRADETFAHNIWGST